MSILLTAIQGLSIVVLTVVGLFSDKIRLPSKITIVIIASFGFLLTTTIKEAVSKRSEAILRQQRDEIREKLFRVVGQQVMESPEEFASTSAQQPSRKIQIKTPQNGSKVPWRAYVEGIVSNPQAEVWVIVHPMGVSAYWVQPSLAVGRNGDWKGMIYLGRAGNIDVGKQFGIMAVANPKEKLSEGDVLGGWPKAQWRSEVVLVSRK